MVKVLYAGSPYAAAQTLEILFKNQIENEFKICGVLTNPPSMQGRHKDLIPTPVEKFAAENNIPVFTPLHLDENARTEIEKVGADILVCFAYGHIFGPKFLSLFRLGGINLHPSLLPKYRGCTPVNAAILNMDNQTAVTIQSLSLKMDEGNILAQQIINLSGTETAESLLLDAAKIGAELIINLLKNVAKCGTLEKGVPQNGEASYTGVLKKEDGKIDWKKSAKEIDAQVRAYFPEPGAWTNISETETLKINLAVPKDDDENSLNVECGTVIRFSKAEGIFIKCGVGQLCVKELQRQGKKSMNYKDFMNGSRDFIDKKLG